MAVNHSPTMSGTRLAWDIALPGGTPSPPIRTLIADRDPISQRVVRGVLSSADRIEVAACVDSRRSVAEWPLRQVDVAVLVLAQGGDSLMTVIRDLTRWPIRVLLLGIDWSRRELDAMLAAGASGCLVKDTELGTLVSGVHAVADGSVVLSPQLLHLYAPGPGSGQRRSLDSDRTLSNREREVLALIGEGLSTADVARRCGVSTATVKSHVSHAISKLGVRNRLEAVLMINGMVPRDGGGQSRA